DLDLQGKYFIFTGGYSGLGLEGVRALAAAGASVIVPARSRAKAEQDLSALTGDIEIADMDLGDINSVRKFAAEYVASGRPLHGLINNAGIMACPLARVGKDWESQFGICHLGHFELTRRLEKPLKNTQGARVVALSSAAHIITDIHWDDPHFHSHDYDKWQAYGQAKSANALFARGLDARWKNDDVRAFSLHPGGIFTPLQRHLSEEDMVALGWKNADGSIPDGIKAMFKSPEQGGATALWCALNPALDGMGGVYCEDCDIAQQATEDSQRYEHAREWICDPQKAERLWEMSEKMIAEG
ncbi:MAG TPA: SDR family NAD(P)-dependent oxidoreductase, partial [Hellea balneolensis]|nr:SDR family NAD(P)-dependent oxidoreductase [Hellea balneolensis]